MTNHSLTHKMAIAFRAGHVAQFTACAEGNGCSACRFAQALIERLTPVQVQHATLPCTPSALLPGGWLCGSCREPIRREYQFCPNCGVPLKWE